MPRSSESLRLAQRSRTAQLAIRAAFLRQFIALWPVLLSGPPERTTSEWLRLSLTLIERWRGPSVTVAREYYRRQRQLDLPGDPLPPLPEARRVQPRKVFRSLIHTGPREIRRARLLGLDELEAQNRALATAAGAAGRHVLDGGREWMDDAAEADRDAVGWLRVTDANPCAFCAMLASRGPVYKSEASAGADQDPRFTGGKRHKYHDNCACSVIPIFTDSPLLPESTKRYRDLWKAVTDPPGGPKLGGNDARIAFRQAIEGRLRK